MRDQTFSSRQALRVGWNTTKANLNPILGIGVIAFLLGAMQRSLSPPQDGLSGLLLLAIQVAQVALMLVWIRVALSLHRGEKLDWSKVPDLLSGFFGFLLTSVLVGLIVAAGFLLLIVPGVIWGLKYGFSTFVVADREIDPISALKESSRLTDGIKWHLLGFFLLCVGVNLLGAMALGVGLFVTVPTTWIAAVHVFRLLQERAAHQRTAIDFTHAAPTPTGA
jgi:uncharacterized membrane protein